MSTNIRYGIFSIVVAAIIAYLSWDFIPAISWGAILAISMYPLHRILSNRINPGVSILILTMGLLSLVVGPLGYIGIHAAMEYPDARESFIDFQENGVKIPQKMLDNKFVWNKASTELNKLGMISSDNDPHIIMPGNITEKVQPIIGKEHSKILQTTLEVSKHTSHIVELVFFTIISFVVFLSGGASLADQIMIFSRKVVGDSGPNHILQLTKAVRGTVTGVVMVGVIQGLAIAVPLVILHCPHPALFVFAIIVSSLIPFCSPLALALAASATFFVHGPVSAIILLSIGLVVIFAADHVVKPKLVGHSTELGFLSSMISILGTLKVLGLIGLFVGPALFSVAATLWKEFSSENS